MRADEKVLATVRGWIEKAENDLQNASLVLSVGDAGPLDTAAFHAQQCAEKHLKALLAFRSIDFPKTHDLGVLISLLPENEGSALGLSVEEQRRLTSYATVTRYPGDYEPVTMTEVRKAVALARRVRRHIRSLLPKGALRRRKR